MIYIYLDGGFGNNLFQISRALEIKEKYHSSVTLIAASLSSKLNTPEMMILLCLADKYKIKIVDASPFVIRTAIARSTRRIRTSKHMNRFLPLIEFIEQVNDVKSGYWQKFDTIDVRMRLLALDLCYLTNEYDARERRKPYAAIHIRLGDYENHVNNQIYASQNIFKVQEALQNYLNSGLYDEVHIVSNDIKRAVELCEVELSDHRIIATENSALEDFVTLANAKHVTTTNSTFCWWAVLVSAIKGNLSGINFSERWFNEGFEHLECPRYDLITSQILNTLK